MDRTRLIDYENMHRLIFMDPPLLAIFFLICRILCLNARVNSDFVGDVGDSPPHRLLFVCSSQFSAFFIIIWQKRGV